MVCLGIEPGAEGWKVQTNPLSFGGTPLPDVGPGVGRVVICEVEFVRVWSTATFSLSWR